LKNYATFRRQLSAFIVRGGLSLLRKLGGDAMNRKSGELKSSYDITSRFEEIYNSTYKDVIAFITSKCNNHADINDIAQDTYVELYSLLLKRGADYIQNENAIVIKLARQKLSRYYTLAERLKNFIPLHFSNEAGADILLPELQKATNEFLTDDFVITKETFNEMRGFLGNKSPDIRKIFYLYFDIGLTLPEIAKALGLKESNVKSKLYRTLKELRKLLEAGGDYL
jgi:RNA polymerase sigma-70 factor (ECF subfamily)